MRNQAVVVPPGYLAVGQIVGAHGLSGELKVEAYSDFPDRFAPGATLYLGEDLEEVKVATVRPHKTNLLVNLEEVGDRNEAEEVRGLWPMCRKPRPQSWKKASTGFTILSACR